MAPLSQFYRKCIGELTSVGLDRLHEPVWKKPSGPTHVICSFSVHAHLNFHLAFKSSFYKFSNKIKYNKGGIIKYLLPESGRARWENIWLSVMVHGPRCAWSLCYYLEPNIFLSSPPTQSISTWSLCYYLEPNIFLSSPPTQSISI